MLVAGYGVFRELRSGQSKKGNDYNLLELGADDYRSCTLFVEPELVSKVRSFKEGDVVQVNITLESVYGQGLRSTLRAIDYKK